MIFHKLMKFVKRVSIRPQFIKAATVSRVLRSPPDITEILIHTGQHYDSNMSEVLFHELEIPKPDYHLGIGSATYNSQTGKVLEAIEAVLIQKQPDWVMVYFKTKSWSKHKLIQLIKYSEAVVRMVLAGRCLSPDLIHANDIDALPINYFMARAIGSRLVYDAHELWSNTSGRSQFPTWILKAV